MPRSPHSYDHANPEEVADYAHTSWDDDMLECRLDRHAFQPLDAAINDREGTFTRTRRCPRCGVEENLERSLRTGEKLRRWLDYRNAKEGYLRPRGAGRMDTSCTNAVWVEYFSRVSAAQKPRKTRRKKAA